MRKYHEIILAQSTSDLQFQAAGTLYIVQTPSGVLYMVYVDTGSDVAFKKSSDGGDTWSAPTVVFAGAVTSISVWYDRWSNIAAGLIHIAYTDSGVDDTLYRTINTESSDALSTQTTIFLGTTTAAGGHLSITRSVGGNVYCKTVIDAGAEGGFYRLPNANVPNGAWDAARTVDETIATNDAMILLPDFDAADTQDIMAIFWDTSANEISRKLYDDSGNSWSETSIATSMTKPTNATNFPNFNIAIDITNTRFFVAAWSAVDTLNADLRCWIVDAGSITEVTNIVLNSTDDQGLVALTYCADTARLYAFYVGASGGTETFSTAVNVYMKISDDAGTTWGPETKLTGAASGARANYSLPWLSACPRWLGYAPPPFAFLSNETLENIMFATPQSQSFPTARHQLIG